MEVLEYNMSTSSKEKLFMDIAIKLSEQSECSKAHVGCLITTKNLDRILGYGYNNGPKKINYICKENKCNCSHAENNAITHTTSDIKDKMFFITMFPCLNCAMQIVNSGCYKIFYHNEYKKGSKHWDLYSKVLEMLKANKIKICQIYPKTMLKTLLSFRD